MQFNSNFWHNHLENNKSTHAHLKSIAKLYTYELVLSWIWDKRGQQGIKAFISILLRLLRQIITGIQSMKENYLSQSSVHINLSAPGHSFREINRPLYRRVVVSWGNSSDFDTHRKEWWHYDVATAAVYVRKVSGSLEVNWKLNWQDDDVSKPSW